MVFLGSKKEKVHLALVIRKKKQVTTGELTEVVSKFGFDVGVMRVMLVRSGILVPLLFRHQYYVRDMNELASRSVPDPLVLAELSCRQKFGKEWYFGLNTALKLNGLAGVQTQTAAFIVTRKPVRPSKRKFLGLGFNFSTIRGVPFSEGVVERDGLRYSGVSRTVLDFLHFGVKNGDTKYAQLVLSEVLEGPSKREFCHGYPRLLKLYPTRVLMSRIIRSHLSGETRVV